MNTIADGVDFRLEKFEFEGRKQTVLQFASQETELKGFIVVDSLALGPATGGCRFTSYNSTAEALLDAQRLARGMSFKNAMAELPLGGGKSVIMKPSGAFDRAAAFEVFGKALNYLNGSYLAAEDVGTSESDMVTIQQTSPFVFGLPKEGAKAGGNPSPRTAHGAFLAILELIELKGIEVARAHVAVQGLGSVGRALSHLLLQRGVRLTVADISEAAIAGFNGESNVTVEDTSTIHRVPADLFAPCALGAGLNARTIPELATKIIAGAANNQLERPEDAFHLAQRGILYAPDYIVNAGGIINVAGEYLGESDAQVDARIAAIPGRLRSLIREAERTGLTPSQVADARANELIRVREPEYSSVA